MVSGYVHDGLAELIYGGKAHRLAPHGVVSQLRVDAGAHGLASSYDVNNVHDVHDVHDVSDAHGVILTSTESTTFTSSAAAATPTDPSPTSPVFSAPPAASPDVHDANDGPPAPEELAPAQRVAAAAAAASLPPPSAVSADPVAADAATAGGLACAGRAIVTAWQALAGNGAPLSTTEAEARLHAVAVLLGVDPSAPFPLPVMLQLLAACALGGSTPPTSSPAAVALEIIDGDVDADAAQGALAAGVPPPSSRVVWATTDGGSGGDAYGGPAPQQLILSLTPPVAAATTAAVPVFRVTLPEAGAADGHVTFERVAGGGAIAAVAAAAAPATPAAGGDGAATALALAALRARLQALPLAGKSPHKGGLKGKGTRQGKLIKSRKRTREQRSFTSSSSSSSAAAAAPVAAAPPAASTPPIGAYDDVIAALGNVAAFNHDGPIVIEMTGAPSSGKSSFVAALLASCPRYKGDKPRGSHIVTGTKDSDYSLGTEMLKAGRDVIVDNTSLKITAARRKVTVMARTAKIKIKRKHIVTVVMSIDKQLASVWLGGGGGATKPALWRASPT